MSFEYLHQPPFAGYDEEGTSPRPTGGIQFQLPEYLYDAPPTLAPGGGAEALHPAQAAQWFANSGFSHGAQYPQYPAFNPAVQDAYDSLETLQGAFPRESNSYLNSNPNWGYGQQGALPWPLALSLNASPPPHTPSPLTAAGLPVYSQSGFDTVSLLARVQNRANPHIRLGPVDFTTSFIVVDVRRHDDPIVYCSPSFCALTGYKEREVLGRNCRFLQAPPSSSSPLHDAHGGLGKGDLRTQTSLPAVRALAKAISGRKEAQVSLVNFRKDGRPFVNLVSVVPLFGEHADDDSPGAECVWYIGFQVDLTVQSEGIVERVREGTYYSGAVARERELVRELQNGVKQGGKLQVKAVEPAQQTPTRERRSTAVPAPRVSPHLARLLATPAFLASCGLHPPFSGTTNGLGLPPDPTSHALHSLLLGELPDFVHVLSLKGAFLYVAPAVTRVLGWAPAELVGRALADVCFARDVVSVGRALKEASLPVEGVRVESSPEQGAEEKGGNSTAASSTNSANNNSGAPAALTPAETLRTVDLVFRARTKQGSWVWVECRGRLHVEPGKGRKAIVLVGRARGMARVPLGTSVSGGLGELRMPGGEAYFGRHASTTPYTSPLGHTRALTSPHMHGHTSPHTPPTPTYPATRSPTGSVSGLEYALQPKRARIEGAYATRGSSVTLRTPSPDPTGISAAVPTAFHGVLDPHGLLLSVGPGARALLGWDPLALRGTRLGALVAPDTRLSAAGTRSPVDAMLAAWRAERTADPANAAAGAAREVRVTLQGKTGLVDAVVRLVAPLPDPAPLPPAVAPARLMYAVRAAGSPPVPRAAGEDVFKRLDPATGGSWQYELQQLRFANSRLEEEIVELEKAERERAEAKEREREGMRERERERVRMEQRAYQQQVMPVRYAYDEQPWVYPQAPLTYQLPMKRSWNQRDEV